VTFYGVKTYSLSQERQPPGSTPCARPLQIPDNSDDESDTADTADTAR